MDGQRSSINCAAGARRLIASRRRYSSLKALLLCTLAGLGSCSKHDTPIEKRRLTVFATIYPLAEIAREVGGDDVRVDWLIELGKPLLDFETTRRERERMLATDFILCDSFRRTETWAAVDLAQRQDTGRVLPVEALSVVGSVKSRGLLCLDPIVARQYAAALSDAFSVAMPERRDQFKTRRDDFLKRLDAIVSKYPNRAFGDARFVTLSPLYGPLLDRFAIGFTSLDLDPYRLTDTDLAEVKKAAVKDGLSRVIVPYDLPPGAVNRIEDGTGLKSIAIDAVGYTEFKGHDTYLDLLSYNLEQLRGGTTTSAAK